MLKNRINCFYNYEQSAAFTVVEVNSGVILSIDQAHYLIFCKWEKYFGVI
jgi:hypothetical protein